MPDWEALVRQQLAGLSLEAGERREVIAELAGHLEGGVKLPQAIVTEDLVPGGRVLLPAISGAGQEAHRLTAGFDALPVAG